MLAITHIPRFEWLGGCVLWKSFESFHIHSDDSARYEFFMVWFSIPLKANLVCRGWSHFCITTRTPLLSTCPVVSRLKRSERFRLCYLVDHLCTKRVNLERWKTDDPRYWQFNSFFHIVVFIVVNDKYSVVALTKRIKLSL